MGNATEPELVWMVFVEGGKVPTVKHDTETSARREAERLASETGKRAFVMTSIAVCAPLKNVFWSNLR